MKYLEKIIEYGLYLLIFLLPVQTRWIIKAGEINGGYWEYGTISLYATDILLILLLLSFVAYKFLNKSKIEKPKSEIFIYWWFIAGLVIASFISTIFAFDKSIAIYGFIRLLLGIGLFWLVVKANYNKLKLVIVFLFAIALQACLAIWQFIYQTSFANKWLGLALHQAKDLGTSVIETVGSDGVGERWLRAYGGLDHPNILGGFMVIGMVLAIGIVINSECYAEIKNKKINLLIYLFRFCFDRFY